MYWEIKLEFFKKKYELATTEKDKKECQEGIKWAKKQLEKYEN